MRPPWTVLAVAGCCCLSCRCVSRWVCRSCVSWRCAAWTAQACTFWMCCPAPSQLRQVCRWAGACHGSDHCHAQPDSVYRVSALRRAPDAALCTCHVACPICSAVPAAPFNIGTLMCLPCTRTCLPQASRRLWRSGGRCGSACWLSRPRQVGGLSKLVSAVRAAKRTCNCMALSAIQCCSQQLLLTALYTHPAPHHTHRCALCLCTLAR